MDPMNSNSFKSIVRSLDCTFLFDADEIKQILHNEIFLFTSSEKGGENSEQEKKTTRRKVFASYKFPMLRKYPGHPT